MPDRKRVCCNCGHNIRHKEKDGIECRCDLDNHYIGYIACFEHWCRHWKKERKWEDERIH